MGVVMIDVFGHFLTYLSYFNRFLKKTLSFPFSNAQCLDGQALMLFGHGGGRPWTERAPSHCCPKSGEQIV